MILFKEDWDKYPTADIDTSCKNKHFEKYASLLKSMGIKNHEWPLALIDQGLKGVDPFDPSLTVEEMMRFAIEFKENPWAYFRLVARAPGGTAETPLYYRANRSNMSLNWLYFNHIANILIQPRQTGKSFGITSLDTYVINILATGADITLLTRGETLRANTLSLMKRLEAELPFYLRARKKDDVANREEIIISTLNNKYRAILPSSSPITADRIGRGLTSASFRGDEFAYLENIAITLPVVLGTTQAARETAMTRGEPYGNIFTTTAGKKDDRDGKYAYDMVTESAVWSEHFYDAKNEEELRDIIKKNSRAGDTVRVNSTFSHRQLGYSDEWLISTMKENNAFGDVANRDYFNVWTSGSQSSPFTPDQSSDIRNSQAMDYFTEVTSFNYIIRWYLPKDMIVSRMNSSYFTLAMDSSDASGGDDCAFVLRDIATGEVVASTNINETNLIKLSDFIVHLLITYPKITFIPERKSSGVMIIDYLLMILPTKGINPFKRIYNKIVQEANDFPDRMREIDRSEVSQDTLVKYKKAFGFATSGMGMTSRDQLYGTTLQSAVKLTRHLVKDKVLIEQLLALIVKNGRVDHPPGEHDDLVVAWLLSFWLMTLGRNLGFYGIDTRAILSENKEHNNVDNIKKEIDHREQDRIRQQIDTQLQRIRNERDDYVVSRLTMDLKHLTSMLREDDRAALSVDELLNKLKKEREMSRFHKRSLFG